MDVRESTSAHGTDVNPREGGSGRTRYKETTFTTQFFYNTMHSQKEKKCKKLPRRILYVRVSSDSESNWGRGQTKPNKFVTSEYPLAILNAKNYLLNSTDNKLHYIISPLSNYYATVSGRRKKRAKKVS